MEQKPRLYSSEYENAKARALKYLASNPHLTNRILRTLAPLTYDQAIAALGRMCDEKVLERHGNAGGTHYVVTASDDAKKGRR